MRRGGLEKLRQGDVDRVVDGQIRPQLPGARQEKSVAVAFERQVGEILQGIGGPRCVEDFGPLEAPQGLSNLEIEQLGRVK